jgi:hypothetical protein
MAATFLEVTSSPAVTYVKPVFEIKLIFTHSIGKFWRS